MPKRIVKRPAMLHSEVSAIADPYLTRKTWTFDKTGDREGWSVPERMTGAVMGGAIWLTPTPSTDDAAVLESANFQFYGDFNPVRRRMAGEDIKVDGPSEEGHLSASGPATRDFVSPSKLSIAWPENQGLFLRVRVLNLSPAFNLLIRWRSNLDAPGVWRSRRCSIWPDVKIWQEFDCALNDDEPGEVEQVAIGISENVIRGDLWFDTISIGSRPPREIPARPDVASAAITPQISIPGLSQAEFTAAFSDLDTVLVADVPAYGFPYPYMIPAGDNEHGDHPWPQVDSVISAAGAAWSNQAFAEDVIRGVAVLQAQNPDGRISGFPWGPLVGQPSDVGVRPDRFFDCAYMIAVRSRDQQFRQMVFTMMESYLKWYMSGNKCDQKTGLIMGDWEEAVGSENSDLKILPGGCFDPQTQARAPVILNAAVAFAAERTARLGRMIGENERATKSAAFGACVGKAINKYLWDEQDGFYYDLDLTAGRLSKKDPTTYAGGGRQNGAFFTLGLVAPPARAERLLSRLTSPEFNWDKGAIPDASLDGGPNVERPRVWGAKIWALTNVPIMNALERAGRHDLAAALNWKFLQLIKGRYYEHYEMDGTPIGGAHYGFTAAAMIDGIAGHLFGVEYRGVEDEVHITPRVPASLFNKDLSIRNLILPTRGDTRLSISIRQASVQKATICVNIEGSTPKGAMTIELPGAKGKVSVPAGASYTANFPQTTA